MSTNNASIESVYPVVLHGQKSIRRNKQMNHQINFQGITLKEYFRRCEQQNQQDNMHEIKQQNYSSPKSSETQTPTFAVDEQNKNIRPKMRTEINDEEIENYFKNNNIKNKSMLIQQHQYLSKSKNNCPAKNISMNNNCEKGQKVSDKIDKSIRQINAKKDKEKNVNCDKINMDKTTTLEKIHVQEKIGEKLPQRYDRYEKKIVGEKKSILNINKLQGQVQNRSTLNFFYPSMDKRKKMFKKIKNQKQRYDELRLRDIFFITKYGSKFQLDSKTLVK